MSLHLNASKPPLQTDETQLEAQPSNLPQEKKQIQNAQCLSHALSINENIENAHQNEGGAVSPENPSEGKAQSISIRWWSCCGASVLQFSILIGLILIQYISSAIHFLPLFITLLITILLHPPLVILPRQIYKILHQNRVLLPLLQENNLSQNCNKEESQIRTIPKINQQVVKRGNAKTKKMQFPKQKHQQEKNTQQTIKKETTSQPSQHDEQTENLMQTVVRKRRWLVGVKVTQVIMEVVMASLSLFIFTDEAHNSRKAVFGLSVSIYLLALVSSLLFLLLINQISSVLHPAVIKPTHERQIEITCEDHQQPKTKISIDQLLQAKPIERNKTYSIEKELKSAHRADDQEQENHEKRECKSEVERETAIKMEIKRSVLKPSKVQKVKSRKNSLKFAEEDMMERRKVEINSKKIQYFEYCQISPSQSVVDEDLSKTKVGAKVKLNAQRAKYMRQRLEAQAKILSNKVMARQAYVKSQACISSPNCQPPKEEDEAKIDHFL